MFTGAEDHGSGSHTGGSAYLPGMSNHGFGASAIGHADASYAGHLSHAGHGLVHTGTDIIGHAASGASHVGHAVSGAGHAVGHAAASVGHAHGAHSPHGGHGSGKH